MRNHRRFVMLAPAVALVVALATPTVEAGGSFGVHVGSGGFGVSVGFGDWGVYTGSWSDPYWSINLSAAFSGYGQWVWVNGLGRVWRPWVTASWRPFTYGRWVSTSYGLTWVAYEPWGYVPHHYGSWAYTSFGWVWLPGYTYSCANVVWVGSGPYVGWYARPPRGWSHARHGFHHGYNHGFRDGYSTGYRDGWDDARYATYVNWGQLGADNVSRHAVPHRVVSQDRIDVRRSAPSRDEVLRRGSAIPQTRLSRRTVTMDGREISIARPEGVARSIERNAVDAVKSLSDEALARRQPTIRRQPDSSKSAAASSRPPTVGETRRSAGAAPVERESSRLQTNHSDTPDRTAAERVRPMPTAPTARSGSSVVRSGDVSRRVDPRGDKASAVIGAREQRSAPSASSRAQSSSWSDRTARPSQKRDGASPNPDRVSPSAGTDRRTEATARQSTDRQRGESDARRSSAASRTRRSSEKDADESARKRRQ